MKKPQNDSRKAVPGARRRFGRRTLVKGGAATAGLLATPASVWAQGKAPATGRVLGANDRIVVAYVGTGNQGMTHVRNGKQYAAENRIVPAAVCDVYQKRLERAKGVLGLSDRDAYRDHRKLLERKEIDAVFVATVDDWHADVAIDALQAGKHVYGEKPLARYLEEGFRIHDTVKRTKKVFQIGSQYCADPKYHKVAEWIRAGKLGPLVWAQGSYCRNNKNNSEWTYPIDPEASPANLDWNRWLGRAPKIAWTPEHYFSWHKFYAYNSGILGNLLSHTFLPLLLATASTEFPSRVTCTGTRKVSTDREINDTTHLLAEMPSGLTFCVVGSTVNEQGLPEMIRGRQGTVYLSSGQNQASFKPERVFADQVEPEDFSDPQPPGSVPRLEKNFFDCIRSGATPVGNIDLALRAHVILALAEQAERTRTTLLFDGKTRKIQTGDGRPVAPLTYDTVLPKV